MAFPSGSLVEVRFVRRRTRVTREVEATRSQMTGYRVSAARRNSLLLGTARSLALGPQSVQGRKGRRVKGVGKKGREARGVFRASCRGVQQVIVFGIHLHASSAFARFLSLSLFLYRRTPSPSLSLSSLFLSRFMHARPPVLSSLPSSRSLRYSIHGVSLYRPPPPSHSLPELYPIAIPRENSSQRGKPRYSESATYLNKIVPTLSATWLLDLDEPPASSEIAADFRTND